MTLVFAVRFRLFICINRTSISFLLSTLLSPESSFFLGKFGNIGTIGIGSRNAKLKIQTSKQTLAHTFQSLRGRQKCSEAITESSSKTKLGQARNKPQTVTWLEKLTAYTKSSKKRLFPFFKKSSVAHVIIVRFTLLTQ